jgi:hypothetical protein
MVGTKDEPSDEKKRKNDETDFFLFQPKKIPSVGAGKSTEGEGSVQLTSSLPI